MDNDTFDWFEIEMSCFWNVICEEAAAHLFDLPRKPGWTKVALHIPPGIKGLVEDLSETHITASCEGREQRVTFRQIESWLRGRYEDLRDPEQEFTMELTFDDVTLRLLTEAEKHRHDGKVRHPKWVNFKVRYRI